MREEIQDEEHTTHTQWGNKAAIYTFATVEVDSFFPHCVVFSTLPFGFLSISLILLVFVVLSFSLFISLPSVFNSHSCSLSLFLSLTLTRTTI